MKCSYDLTFLIGCLKVILVLIDTISFVHFVLFPRFYPAMIK